MDGQSSLILSDSTRVGTRIIESLLPLLRYRHFRHAATFIITLYAFVRFLQSQGRNISLNYLSASIHFDDSHELYHTILSWASQRFAKARRLKATPNEPRQQEESEMDDGTDSSEIFHIGRWSAKTQGYEPFYGKYWFLDGGRLFLFERRQEKKTYNYFHQGDDENIVLSTPGRSTEPIKGLLKVIKDWELEREKPFTTVWVPRSKDTRRFQAWKKVAWRRSRLSWRPRRDVYYKKFHCHPR
ncbi:hypothetical protein K469DRAFT_683257 [Zopfia rhizophila CBS 207.26]|uniref:BCS1 N-terminal domain-containing protein n=1 Tax=Zopfia rhizophila CBS 207.26 TaxID=1314779 RepID=A0A6A6ED15_9PEZI|nr:hypothetical protein K469DRAFT_683257 [Zopfia rhizophila CBS 207.26]